MTAETRDSRSGPVSGNTPGIQTRTSDILFLSRALSDSDLELYPL